MANHRAAAAALLLIASLLVAAVALSDADANGMPTVRPDKPADFRGVDVMRTGGNTMVTVGRDANGPGHVPVAAAQGVVEPECDEEEEPQEKKYGEINGEAPTMQPGKEGNKAEPTYHPGQPDGGDGASPPDGGYGDSQLNSEESALDQALCSDCEEPPPPCDTCESEPELSCNEVRAVREGETCESVVECAGLGQDDFLRFNPNLCCDKLFVGQWVCLDATCAA